MRATIPEDAEIGDEYLVQIRFTANSADQTGGLALGTAIQKSFHVLVASKEVPKKLSLKTIITSILILIAVIIAIIMMIKRRRK